MIPRRARHSVWVVDVFVVERYLPDTTAAQVCEAEALLSAAAHDLAATGTEIHFLGSTFVPVEEYCFCRFESDSLDNVRRACERAGVSYARIVQARDLQSARRTAATHR